MKSKRNVLSKCISGLALMLLVSLLTVGVFGILRSPRVINRAVEHGLASVVEDVISTVVHIRYEGDGFDYHGKKIAWQGSGVIISKEGLILTARHVCKVPGKFTVTLADGREFITRKSCVSREYDVGYLKIEDTNDFSPATFGDSDKMRLGSRILAFGSPWGKQHFNSVTLGILSARERDLSEEVPKFGWEILFQTDVAANPGNSGGPVFNTNGEVVGIVVGLYGPGCYAGITYCVPSNVCEKLVEVVNLTLALRDVETVETNERLDKLEDLIKKIKDNVYEDFRYLEDKGDGIEDDLEDIERRLKGIEFEMARPHDDRIDYPK